MALTPASAASWLAGNARPSQQREQHLGPARLSDQGRDPRDVSVATGPWSCRCSMVMPRTLAAEHFGVGRRESGRRCAARPRFDRFRSHSGRRLVRCGSNGLRMRLLKRFQPVSPRWIRRRQRGVLSCCEPVPGSSVRLAAVGAAVTVVGLGQCYAGRRLIRVDTNRRGPSTSSRRRAGTCSRSRCWRPPGR